MHHNMQSAGLPISADAAFCDNYSCLFIDLLLTEQTRKGESKKQEEKVKGDHISLYHSYHCIMQTILVLCC